MKLAEAVAPPRDHELLSLQCLRGVAAMMVVFYHAFPQLSRMGYAGEPPEYLSSGVDIFFIISGFIMLYATHRSPQRTGADFLINRAVRILPLYWIMTSVMVMAALFLPHLLNSTRFVASHVIASYLMLPAIHPVTGVYQPILIPGWTLNCEMFFYVIFAAGLMLIKDRGWRLAMLVGACIAFIVALRMKGVGSFYSNWVMLEFVFGLAIACLFLRGWRIGRAACVALLLSGGALMIAAAAYKTQLPDIRSLFFGVPALMIFVGALYLPLRPDAPATRILRVAGDASYSIYLSHMMGMSAIGFLWRRLLPQTGTQPLTFALFLIVSALLCAIAGWLCYLWLEKPVTRWLKQRLAR